MRAPDSGVLLEVATVLLVLPTTLGGFGCLSNPCIHGVCLDDLNSTYNCYCIDGYTGVQCQTNWDECWSSPCKNGGVCQDGIASFNCSCPEGFVGDVCEEDFNECASNPCLNNGTCRDRANGYVCNCVPGYSGTHCEVDVAVCNTTAETRCLNGGVCIEGPGASFSCRCPAGWDGFLCEHDTDECLSAPCRNGGVCIDMHADYACACLFGFVGKNCEEKVSICTDNPCKNRALCLTEEDESVCYCVPDYHGDRCQYQYDECQLGPRCMNGGTCIDGIDNFTCSCPPDLTGLLCECLILEDNELDCNYVRSTPSTSTTTAYVATTYMTSESATSQEDISIVPLTSTTVRIEESTTPQEDVKATTDVIVVATTETVFETTPEPLPDKASSTVPNLTTFYPQTTTSREDMITYDTSPTRVEVLSTTFSSPPSLLNLSTLPPETEVYYTATSISLQPPTTDWEVTSEKVPEGTSTFKVETTAQTEYVDVRTLLPISTTVQYSTEESIVETIGGISGTEFSMEQSTPYGVDNATITKVAFTDLTAPTFVTITRVTYPLVTSTEYSTPPLAAETQVVTEGVTIIAEGPSTDVPEGTTEGIDVVPSLATTVATTTEKIVVTSGPIEVVTLSTSKEGMEGREDWISTTEIAASTIGQFFTEEPAGTTTAPGGTEMLTTGQSDDVSSTVFPKSDCSDPLWPCQNGGSCVKVGQGDDQGQHRCVCTFNFDGPFCETHLGIQNAAFSGDSFLSHRLLNRTGMLVELKANTLSANGLLFCSNIDSTYMAVYVEKGYLKFKFSCGLQTMLLSEIDVPVNTGYDILLKANLQMSKDLQHCNATLTLNETMTMSGEQVVKLDNFQQPISWIHLGGIPDEQDLAKLQFVVPNFMGCMSELRLNGKKRNIFKDAENGFEVTECSSLACLSSPCANGASCIENGENWVCNCKNGYVGRSCETSVCENNPCQFGATCMPFTGSGYICLCPFGKHGHFCESELDITEPSFSSSINGLSSYAAYPIPAGISNDMEIKFKFSLSTMDQISILLFIGQSGMHDEMSDHVAVSFVKGYIMLTWNLGSGPRRIFTVKPINNDESSVHLVRLGKVGRRAWLAVDNLGNVTGRSPGNLIQLNIFPTLYLGGHESPNFTLLPHDLPLHTGFSGCIFDVQLKAGNIVVPVQGSRHAVGRALGQCGTSECHERACHNGGACLHHGSTFTCLCQDSWYDPLCSLEHNPCDVNKHNCSSGSTCIPLIGGYECDCPPGKIGTHCEKDENLSDVSLSGKRSYINIKGIQLESSRFNFEIEVRPLHPRGLVLFFGKFSGKCFISLSLHSGVLELRLNSGRRKIDNNGELAVVRSNKLLAMGVWYKVKFGKYGKKLHLKVDNVTNTGLLKNNGMPNMYSHLLYLGGVPDMSKLPTSAMSTLPIFFKGCLRKLKVNSQHIPLSMERISEARNVADCDGTPCGGDVCQHGGECWLDPDMEPHCSCPEPYMGDRCERVASCAEKGCRNRGICKNTTCSCTVGYGGAFCETAINVKTPEFLGNSYLIIEGKKGSTDDRKRDLKNLLDAKSVFLNFSTASTEGLLLWSNKDDEFLGIGIEHGFLKIAWGWHDTPALVVDVPSADGISDGLWHTLQVSFHPNNVTLWIDNKVVHTQNTAFVNENSNHLLETNGIFYLGGLPEQPPLIEKTKGIFQTYFKGCIQALGTNHEDSITDFSYYEGENIGTCNV